MKKIKIYYDKDNVNNTIKSKEYELKKATNELTDVKIKTKKVKIKPNEVEQKLKELNKAENKLLKKIDELSSSNYKVMMFYGKQVYISITAGFSGKSREEAFNNAKAAGKNLDKIRSIETDDKDLSESEPISSNSKN